MASRGPRGRHPEDRATNPAGDPFPATPPAFVVNNALDRSAAPGRHRSIEGITLHSMQTRPIRAMTAGGDDERRRRLDRAPGERYRVAPSGAPGDAETEPPAPDRGSIGRSVAFAIGAALSALVVYAVLAGPFAFTAGLVVVGIFAGRVIGLSARAGGGVAITSDQSVLIAIVTTIGWFVLAQVSAWVFARSEGGVLPIIEFLLDVFGPVVPLVAIASVLAAWWSAR